MGGQEQLAAALASVRALTQQNSREIYDLRKWFDDNQVEAKTAEEMLRVEIDTVNDTLTAALKDNYDQLRDSIAETDKELAATNETIKERIFVTLGEHADDLARLHDKAARAVTAHQKLSDTVRDQGDAIADINLTLNAVNGRADYLERQLSESNEAIRGNLADTELNMAKLSDKMDKHMDAVRGGLKALLDQGADHIADELSRIGRHLGELDQTAITLKMDVANVGQEAQRGLAEHALLHERAKGEIDALVAELDAAKADSVARDVALTEGLTRLRADTEERANGDLAKLTAHHGALRNEFQHLKVRSPPAGGSRINDHHALSCDMIHGRVQFMLFPL